MGIPYFADRSVMMGRFWNSQTQYYLRKGNIRYPAMKVKDIIARLQEFSLSFNCEVWQGPDDWVSLSNHEVLSLTIAEKIANAHFEKKHPVSSIFTHWFITNGHSNYGPFSLIQMIEFLQEKRVNYNTLIYHPNYIKWMKISEVPPFKPDNVGAIYNFSLLNSNFSQRKYIRAAYYNQVLVFDDNAFYSGNTWSLSSQGLGVKIEKKTPFNLKDHLNLHIQANSEHEAVQAKAVVVSLHEKNNEVKLGLKFDHEVEALSTLISRINR